MTTFKNPKKVWDFTSLKIAKPLKEWDSSISMKMDNATVLACICDKAIKRVLLKSHAAGERPEQIVFAIAEEMRFVMDFINDDDVSFDLSRTEDSLSMILYRGQMKEGCPLDIITATNVSPADLLSAIGIGLCCMSLRYGRDAIRAFVGSSADKFPTAVDPLGIFEEDDPDLDKIQQFSALLIFEEEYHFPERISTASEINFITLADPGPGYTEASKEKPIDRSLD